MSPASVRLLHGQQSGWNGTLCQNACQVASSSHPSASMNSSPSTPHATTSSTPSSFGLPKGLGIGIANRIDGIAASGSNIGSGLFMHRAIKLLVAISHGFHHIAPSRVRSSFHFAHGFHWGIII